MICIAKSNRTELKVVSTFQPTIAVTYVIIGIIPCRTGIFHIIMLIGLTPHVFIIVTAYLMLSGQCVSSGTGTVVYPFEELSEPCQLKAPVFITDVDVQICFKLRPRRFVRKQLTVVLCNTSVTVIVYYISHHQPWHSQ